MEGLRTLLNHWAVLWAVLCLPAIYLSAVGLMGDMSADAMLHTSGEVSVRLMLVALWVTPLCLLFPKHRWPRWLLARRRWFGVASFGYVVLHAAIFVLKYDFRLTPAAILLGWLALLAMVPLAATSTNTAVRLLGRRWKSLQRLVYAAAALTVLHWLLLEGEWIAALVHFGPILGAEIWRYRRVSVA